MGWTTTHREEGTTIKNFFQRKFVMDNEKKIGKVIDCKVIKWHTAYIAYKITNKQDNTSKIIALVCLIHHNGNAYHNFGYKDMSEDMEPFYYDCPKSILELLTKPNNVNALNWRKKCAYQVKGIIKNKDLLNKDLIPQPYHHVQL